MRHIIKKEIIALTLDKQVDAFDVQHRFSIFNQNEILPALQEIFDGLTTEEQVMQIDKLEIDLGVISEKMISAGKWNIDLMPTIYDQVHKAVGGSAPSHKIIKETRALHISRQWLSYMQYGYLPWNAFRMDEAMREKILETLATDYWLVEELRVLIRRNGKALARIIYQHPLSFLVALTELLTAKGQDELPEAISEICQVTVARRKTEKDIWKDVLQWTAVERDLSADAIIEKIIEANFTVNEIKSVLQSAVFTSRMLVTQRVWEKASKKEAVAAKPEVKQVAPEENPRAPATEQSLDEEGVYVFNAGAVLLHPFLPSFFKNLRLFSGKNFENEMAHRKALYLIHYLATGKTRPEEYELVVEKILCAYPLEEPVDKSLELTDHELEEAGQLLDALIAEWAILKNTSHTGLREGFLQRNGKLYKKNGNLYLQVEGGSIDVLLDQLPWNLTMIKLPWMKEMLRVEWR